jgi:hypothetical protein
VLKMVVDSGSVCQERSSTRATSSSGSDTRGTRRPFAEGQKWVSRPISDPPVQSLSFAAFRTRAMNGVFASVYASRSR